MPDTILNVGLIGCGEVAQVVHIPTLSYMSDWFRITYLCDISANALEHCSKKINNHVPTITTDPAQLCSSSEVDVVLVANSDEYHAEHAILALKHHKHVLVEKPLALTKRDILAVIEAEKKSRGKVMVGYMRRYAACFEDAVAEIGGMDKILYARVRDVIGPNSVFVGQSGAFPKGFSDFSPKDSEDKQNRALEMIETAFRDDCGGIPVTPESRRMWRLLGGLGSHDLSAMREALGAPKGIVGAALGFPFWNVLFQYPGFTVSYESGLDNVPRFDAHIEVYSSNKTVRIQYDTPYVKGLPVTLHVSENVDGAYKESKIRKSYEDPYTKELRALWSSVVEGVAVKTTAEDALQDIEMFATIMKSGFTTD